jgi:hypothetical protein
MKTDRKRRRSGRRNKRSGSCTFAGRYAAQAVALYRPVSACFRLPFCLPQSALQSVLAGACCPLLIPDSLPSTRQYRWSRLVRSSVCKTPCAKFDCHCYRPERQKAQPCRELWRRKRDLNPRSQPISFLGQFYCLPTVQNYQKELYGSNPTCSSFPFCVIPSSYSSKVEEKTIQSTKTYIAG